LIKKCVISFGVFILIFTVVTVSAVAQDEQEKEVIALGMAGGQASRARDEAINNALRNAVEQGVGTYITSETTVEQMTLVEDRIYSESRGYIKSYEILREGPREGVYEVKISAIVKMEQLADDLESIGLLIRKKRNPRVMVVIYSKKVDSPYMGVVQEGNRNAENQIESTLMQKGFHLVDPAQVRRKKELKILLSQGDPYSEGPCAFFQMRFGSRPWRRIRQRSSFQDTGHGPNRELRPYSLWKRLPPSW
jgi:hypothetical protein